MFQDREFGRRRPQPNGGSFPWRGRETEFGCNLAFADLVHNFPAWIAESDGRVHAPTLLAAIGAVAGMAAEMASIAGMADGLLDRGDYHEIILRDGRRMPVGSVLRERLWARDESRFGHALGSTLAMEAQKAGVDWDTMSVGLFSTDVWERICTEAESWPEAPPEHRPALSARELLRLVWPLARTVLTQSYPQGAGKCGPASVHLWPAVTTQAARVLYGQLVQVVPPRIGVIIVLQSAEWARLQEPWPYDPELCRRRDAGMRAFDM